MTTQEAIEKCRKLLKLANCTGATPEEAARAAEMAAAIMARHELDTAAASLAEPEQPREEVKDFGADPVDNNGRDRWRGWLLLKIAHLHGCHCYRNGGRLALIGRPSDVATVRYLYSWISAQIIEISGRATVGNGRTYANNFRIGMVETIARRMETAKREAEDKFRTDTATAATGGAIVLASNAIALRAQHLSDAISYGRQKLHLRSSGGGGRFTHDGAAREQGRAAGNRVNLGGNRASMTGGAYKLTA
jgi:hypothetical protein